MSEKTFVGATVSIVIERAAVYDECVFVLSVARADQ